MANKSTNKWTIIIIVCVLIICYPLCMTLLNRAIDCPQTSGQITVEQYYKAEKGMTYDEVRELFQNDGHLSQELGQPGTSGYLVYFSWELKEGGRVSLSFEGPDLILTYKKRYNY